MTRTLSTICLGLVALGAGCDRRSSPAEPTSIDAALRRDLARWGVIPIGPMPAPAVVDLLGVTVAAAPPLPTRVTLSEYPFEPVYAGKAKGS